MNRFQVLSSLSASLADALVVCNLGFPSMELYAAHDRPSHFYMLGSMGLASSIALGVAINSEREVVAIEGDGAVLMNLGSLATIANHGPKNLTVLILDNGSYGSTGDQPTHTAGVTSLSAMAAAAGIANVFDCEATDADATYLRATREEGPRVVRIQIEPGNVPIKPIPLHPIAIRDRFVRAIGSPSETS